MPGEAWPYGLADYLVSPARKGKAEGVARSLSAATQSRSFSCKCKTFDESVIFLTDKSQQTAKNSLGDSALVSSSNRCLPAGCSDRPYLLLDL
jgi:tRNA/tmRNA/rRNA uracil-C5-methylase (TrmA/RlmC/RlmD family)